MTLPDFDNYAAIRPIIDALVIEINEEQILTSITALEVLSEVTAIRKQNANFLGSIGLLDRTYDLFEKSSYNPDGGLIHSGLFLSLMFIYNLFNFSLYSFFWIFNTYGAKCFNSLSVICT